MFDTLRNKLNQKQLTMKAYAEFLGITEKTLQNKMNGISSFTLPEIEKTCKFLFPETKVEVLFFDCMSREAS